jgi:ABC-type microcin C transport system duplicated ATPase subunit YejF
MKVNRPKSHVTKINNNMYVHDNLARKAERKEKAERRLRRVNLQNEKRARLSEDAHARMNYGIDFASAFVLTIALVCIIGYALNYLTLSSQITELDKQVSTLSSTLDELTSENDEAYAAIDSSVDLGEVYRVAVSELGMVYPDENQVVTYDYVEEGYVRQYKDVPEN